MFRDVIERFIGRYEVWHEQRRAERARDSNPLSAFAIFAFIFIVLDAYRAIVSQHVEWRMVVGNGLLIAFVVLYLRKSKFAWLIFPVGGTLFLLETPWVYFSAMRYRFRDQVFAVIFCVAIGLGVIGYGFLIRKRYEAYLDRSRHGASLQ